MGPLSPSQRPETRPNTAASSPFFQRLLQRLNPGDMLRDFMEFQRLPVFYCQSFSELGRLS